MKTVNFQKISFQNFLSVGETLLELDFTTGINIITGENLDNLGSKNGIGKSTILNFLFWVIFGETITDLKKSRIQHNKSKDECHGTLNFTVNDQEYTIKRTLDPSSIKVLKGAEDITLSTIDKNNDFIKNLIGSSQDVFKNSVILTSDNTLPFLALKKIDKRKFIEGIMNLDVFSDMLLKVRKDYNDKKKESDTITALFSNEQKNLKNLQDQKVLNKKTKEEKIEKLKDQIVDNNKLIENLEKEGADVNRLNLFKNKLIEKETKIDEIETKELPEKNTEIFNRRFSISDLDAKINNKTPELKELQKSTGTCPSCKRPYSEDNCGTEERIDELKEEIGKIRDERDVIQAEETRLSKELSLIKQTVTDLKSDITKIKKEIERLTGLNNQIKIIEAKNGEILRNLSSLEEETDNIDVLIKVSEDCIKELSEKIKEYFKELDILDHAKAIVSEEGVKKVIISRILTFLNGRLNYYLSTLEAPCSCAFDDTFDTALKTIGGKEIDYWNLSGGERKRVDSAIIFCFIDLLRLQTGVSYNLCMIDELFDSAIDEKGLEKILEILRKYVTTNDVCVYLVSHNPNTTRFDIDNTVYLQKKDGITTLKV